MACDLLLQQNMKLQGLEKPVADFDFQSRLAITWNNMQPLHVESTICRR